MCAPVMKTTLNRYLIRNCIAGLLAGAIAALLLIISDIGGLKTMLLAPSEGILPGLVFITMFALTFGALAMGVAVMALSETEGSVPRLIHRFYCEMAREAERNDEGR